MYFFMSLVIGVGMMSAAAHVAMRPRARWRTVVCAALTGFVGAAFLVAAVYPALTLSP